MIKKRDVYRALCAVFGAVSGLLLAALLELLGLSRGWAWAVSESTYDALRFACVVGFAAMAWCASARWWQVLYVEQRYGKPRL